MGTFPFAPATATATSTLQPYQFQPETYGAKGDGIQALVTVAASSGTVNTTPLGAPASGPTVTHSTSGGTLLAGTYKAEVTYVNQWGETTASASTTFTTSTATSLATVAFPPFLANATGWYAYITQAGGSTYTRQQAAGSPYGIGKNFILTAPPTSTGATPPGSDTTAARVFTSTAVDGGKNIMINGALGSPAAPLVDTIATVVSPTQCTLNSVTATANQAGCAMVFSTDDRLAIDSCMSAAAAYMDSGGIAQVIFGNKIYGLGTGHFQTTGNNGTNPASLGYNTQIRLPVGNNSGYTPFSEIQLIGAGDGTNDNFWLSQFAGLTGTCLLSYSIGPSGADGTYGQQSVVGGPQTGNDNFAGGSNGFFNIQVVIRNLQVVMPGWTNSVGIDLQWMGGCVLRGSSNVFAPRWNSNSATVNPSQGWVGSGGWQALIGIALRLPNAQNNDNCVLESFTIVGVTVGISCEADHIVITRLATMNCYKGIQCVPGPGNVSHDLTIAQWSFENVSGNALENPGGGAGTVPVNIVMDGENSGIGHDIRDAGNSFTGIIYWSDIDRSAATPTVQGAANVKIINTMIGPGHMASPPAVPATSPATAALVWRDAWVVITSGGAAVSAITIDGTATGLTLGASGSVTVRVPSGKTIALTYASTAPTWAWWLD